jgi:O-antigen/teichoic acid export membrane protein
LNDATTKIPKVFRLEKLLERLNGRSAKAIFFKGAAGSFAAKLVGAGLLFFAQVLLARLLGVSQYGIYAYALSWMTVLAIIAKMGFETSLLRFLPEYSVKRQWSLFRGVIRFSFTIVGLVAAGIFIIGHVLLFFLRSHLDANLLLSLRIMLLVLPLFAWTAIRQSCLRGVKRIVHAEVPESILRPLVLAAAAWIFSKSLLSFSAAWAWLCQFIAVFFSFLYGTFLLSKALPDEYKQHASETRRAQWIKVSSPMLLMNSMNIIMAQASIVILGFYQPTTEVALFSASIRIVILATFALLAVNSIAAPLISELYYADKKNVLQSLLRNAAAAIAAITIVAGLFLFFCGRWILGLFGSEFLDAYILLQILLVGFIVKSLAGPASYVLNLTGHQNLTAKAMLIAVIISLLLNFILIPRFGAVGAAMASSITMIIWNVTLLVLNVRIVGINPSLGSLFQSNSNQRAA